MASKAKAKKLRGADWRLRMRHPRGQRLPMRVTLKDGTPLGIEPGGSCEGVDPKILASLIRNDFVVASSASQSASDEKESD